MLTRFRLLPTYEGQFLAAFQILPRERGSNSEWAIIQHWLSGINCPKPLVKGFSDTRVLIDKLENSNS